MVKRVDYSSRFEFLRQAAFALVLEVGVHALTLRALAVDLGLGVNTVRRLVDPATDLAVLAAYEVRTRRRRGRWGQPSADDPEAAARILMRRLLPDDETRIDEEIVWLRLVTSCAVGSVGSDARGQVRHDFQVAERGWSERDLDTDTDSEVYGETDGDVMQRPHREPTAFTPYLDERQSEVDNLVDRTLDLLCVADPDAERIRLRALVEGLTLAVCLGRVSPAECIRSMDRHLAGLARPPVNVAG